MTEITQSAFTGQTISAVEIVEQSLIITFERNRLVLTDEGQQCCEARYMSCDDDLQYFVGSTFLSWEVREVAFIDTGYDVHEIQILLTNTTIGTFTVVNHNEHNGYYGGLSIIAEHFHGSEQVKL